MFKKEVILLAMFVFLFSCANNKIEQKNDLMSDQNGFDVEEVSDFIIEGEEDKDLSFESVPGEINKEEIVKVEIPQEELGEYRVKKHDTLMYIAFKVYGDYSRWRELLLLNDHIVGTSLRGIDKIYYKNGENKFRWQPRGNPYLIKRGDSLSRISGNVYGIKKRWREIYNNNREMIRDPNLIFAGFTLYYVPDRSLASE